MAIGGNLMSDEELWERTAKALYGGDFTLLDELLTEHDASIVDLLEVNGWPQDEMNEAFAWACFTGRTADAETLLDKGVDPAKSDKTGLAGFHWAANRGNFETVRMLIRRKAPMEQLNMYGGSVLGQTLWSAVNEHRDAHADVIEDLVGGGAALEPGTLEWWNQQAVPSTETKARVADILSRSGVE